MEEFSSRTALLLGDAAIEKLARAKVLLFGVGGVGGYALEALVRAGVGRVDVVDADRVSDSNRNRQILALTSTVGEYKVDAARRRAQDINPNCVVNAYPVFFLPENADGFDFSAYDYVVDAIDTVAGKLAIVECAQASGVPVISAMGAGNKLDPTRFEVADIYHTSVCPLAAAVRRECRRRGILPFKVVYSKEEPRTPLYAVEDGGKRAAPGSLSFVPSVAGLILAGEVIRDLCGLAFSKN